MTKCNFVILIFCREMEKNANPMETCEMGKDILIIFYIFAFEKHNEIIL